MNGRVTSQDVDEAVTQAVRVLEPVVDLDWHLPANGLSWTCWETVEHIADDLFAYAMQLGPKRPPVDTYVPVAWQRPRPNGPLGTVFAEPASGPRGLLQVLEACGALLVAMTATADPSVRAYHPDGVSDPEGFAAMGVVETVVHMHDVARGLGLAWSPPADLCDRVLHRLFRTAPTNTDRWPTLLWATGRGELPGRPRLASWRWDSTPRR